MSKTTPTYKKTKLWILEIKVIENIIFDNIILVKTFILNNYNNLDLSTFSWTKRNDFIDAMKKATFNNDLSNLEKLI